MLSNDCILVVLALVGLFGCSVQPGPSAPSGPAEEGEPIVDTAGTMGTDVLPPQAPAVVPSAVNDAYMPMPSAGGEGAPDVDAGAGFDFPDPADSGLRDAGIPRAPLGEPLPGSQDTWTYTEFTDTQCRDGSPAGVFVNLGSTDKLMIFLEGGGRCVNEETCGLFVFPANVEGGSLVRFVASGGILDRERAENPVGDWNIVYVPYCTGDRHGGANPDGIVPGVGRQHFVGYHNLRKFLSRIVPTFPDTTDVLLTGISAGGFGVARTAELVQRAFQDVKIKTINDSGPFVSSNVFTPCDQERTRTQQALEKTFLADCGADCPNPNDYWMDYGVHLARRFADRPTGFISSMEDTVERMMFGIGVDNCTGALDLFNPGIPAADFRADVLSYREKIAMYPNASTFYIEGDAHTYVAFDEFYTVTSGGMRLVDWFATIVNGRSPGHVGP